jgi:hypothetical protein
MASSDPRTTESILYGVFTGDDGARAAAGLARMGSLFLDQMMTDPRQMAEQNLVKQYLRQAGFELRIVQSPQPFKVADQGNPIDNILKA